MPTTCLNSPSPAESQLEEGLRNTEAFRFEQGTGMLGWSRWVSLLCTFGWWKKCIVVFRFWIIFAIIILNSFSCRLISSSFIWFGGHLSCSFTCWVFLCLFILFRLLCLGCPFCILAVCGFSILWRFLPVGGVGWVACQGFLVREACVSVLVGGAGFLLSGVQWSVQ